MYSSCLYLSIAKDFSETPGPGSELEGKFSGEEFYNKILYNKYVEAKDKGTQLIIDLDGTYGYINNFFRVAFQLLESRFGAIDLLDTLIIKSHEEKKWIEVIEEFIKGEVHKDYTKKLEYLPEASKDFGHRDYSYYVTLVDWDRKDLVVVEVRDHWVNVDEGDANFPELYTFIDAIYDEIGGASKLPKHNYNSIFHLNNYWQNKKYIDFADYRFNKDLTLKEIVKDIIRKYNICALTLDIEDDLIDVSKELPKEEE